jgi:hypothetical protein
MEEVLSPGVVLLLGELHGSNEIPAFVGTLACHLASAGQPVVVGLQLPHEEQRTLQRYLQSNGGPQARAELVEGPAWRRPHQDGRTSEAMVTLLEQLRLLRSQGLPLSVLAYDAQGQGSIRSAAMARHVLQARSRSPHSAFLLLGGNVHTRTARGIEWDPSFTPMGWHLVRAHLPVRSLDARYARGTAWTCHLDKRERLSCDSHPARPPPPPPDSRIVYRGRRPFVQLAPRRSLEGFDGIFYVGPLSASPPAVASTLGLEERARR